MGMEQRAGGGLDWGRLTGAVVEGIEQGKEGADDKDVGKLVELRHLNRWGRARGDPRRLDRENGLTVFGIGIPELSEEGSCPGKRELAGG